MFSFVLLLGPSSKTLTIFTGVFLIFKSFVYVCGYATGCIGAHEGQKWSSNLLELEFEAIARPQIEAGNRIWDLCKSSIHS